MHFSCIKKDSMLKEWVDIWFEVYAKSQLKESSQNIYSDARRRLKIYYPDFENISVDELTLLSFQSVLNSFSQRFSKSTIHRIKLLYSNVYKFIIANRGCDNNPIEKVIIPKGAHEKIVKALTKEEENQFKSTLHWLAPIDDMIIRFFLYTGLRRGELISLEWDNWNRRTQRIIITDSKTKQGEREIPLVPEARAILEFQFERHKNSKNPCKNVFAINSEPVKKGHLRHICKRTARLAEIRHVTPHMLRHTFATRLMERGATPKAVSRLLGHADVAFTMQRYVTPDLEYIENQIMLLSDMKSQNIAI